MLRLLLKRPNVPDTQNSAVSGASQLKTNPNFDRVPATHACKAHAQQWFDEGRSKKENFQKDTIYCIVLRFRR